MFRSKRVEEDLARIRHANMPDKYPLPIEKKALPNGTEEDERFGFKDILAMIIAAFSIIIPYVLIFVGVMAIILYIVYLFFLR